VIARIIPEWLIETILRQAAESGDPTHTAARHGITLAGLQEMCGASEEGHRWETYDRGDGVFFESWSCCATCGTPDDRTFEGMAGL